jgi:hypothetical protein
MSKRKTYQIPRKYTNTQLRDQLAEIRSLMPKKKTRIYRSVGELLDMAEIAERLRRVA